MSEPNINKVCKTQWKKWDEDQRYMFNTMYNTVLKQSLVKHPDAPMLSKIHWNTVAWNTAFIAACYLNE